MRILIVEDNPTERDLLRYLLEGRFQSEAKFREANSIETASRYLEGRNIDCVILDLQLPDSIGKETFTKLNDRYPEVPIIVMTHNKDRDLAIEMIRLGAADYILKDYTNEEDIFRRVMFAIEKHQRTIRLPIDKAASIHALDQAKATMLSAHESGKPEALQKATTETTQAMSEVTKHLFTEMQAISIGLERKVEKDAQVYKLIEDLKTNLLGGPDQISIRNKIEGLEDRLKNVERALTDRSLPLLLTKRSYWLGLGIFVLLSLIGTGWLVGCSKESRQVIQTYGNT